MKKEEMNKIIGMLDDDVIADGMSEKKTEGITIRLSRKLAVSLVAAALAVAMLASGIIIGLSRFGEEERVNVLPPVGVQVIKHVASGAQITKDTANSGGYYPYVESPYVAIEPNAYVTAGGLEMSELLYNDLVRSNDPNRTWSIEVSISPNLYITKEYLSLEMERMLSEVTAEQLDTIIGIYEQGKDSVDIDALYNQYKDQYELLDLYKYVKSGQLDRDLVNADIEALTKKASQMLENCGEIKNDFWMNLEPVVLAELERLGVPFVKEGDSYVIFVTEGELLSLSGIEGICFENADYKIDVNEYDPYALSERAGKKITKRLSDAFNKNEGEGVLFAVLVESASVAEIGDKSAYEQEYLELFKAYAACKVYEAALRGAVEGGEKLEKAVEICGQDVVNKYIKDGAFDSALFESDKALMGAQIEEMKTKLYGNNSAEVYDAFKDSVNYIEITEQGSVIIYVTAAEFDALTFEGDFVFNLAA
jgi:hypothetical protein